MININLKNETAEKPNILLITTDTHRWDALMCMGNAHAISPNLDRLAAEGVMFTQGHTVSAVCMPARCSLLTGLHTPVHGCIENGINRRNDVPMMTDYLKKQGYTNIMVGKTHFGPIPESFDIQYVLKGEKGNNVKDFYEDYITKKGYSRVSSYPNPIPEDLFIDACIADKTIESMEQVSKENKTPFFAFCSLVSPHSPLDPPGKWANLYEGIPLPEITYVEGEIENHPVHLRRLVGTSSKEEIETNNSHITNFESFEEACGITITGKSISEIDKFRRLYYGLAAYCDEQVGKIMHYLDESGLRENTLVIFTSYHGQQYFDHGFNDKHNYYDSSWRVPFLMSMPGTIPMGEKREFAISTDVTATILGAAGSDCASVQGFDLFTPLKEGKDSPRKCAVATLYKSAALATKRWKLEYYFEEAEGRLFDRKNDPAEQVDLYGNPLYREVRDKMARALLHWRSDICDVEFLVANTGGGGPVAKRIASRTKAMRGQDSEQRLNELVKGMDDFNA